MRTLLPAILLVLLVSCEEPEPFSATIPVQIQTMAPPELDAEGNRNRSVHLDGDQERPNPVDTKAQGQAIFKLSKDGNSLSYKLIVANIENVSMAHLHLISNPETGTGGVVTWLYPDGPPALLIPGRTNGVLADGVITSDDLTGALGGETLASLIDAMNDGKIYVNVHTQQNPPGEIRGDIEGVHQPS